MRIESGSGVGRFESSGGGPGEFVISGCLDPYPQPVPKKFRIGFLRFTWTPLGSSGGGGVRTPGPLRPATPLDHGC